MNQIELFGIRYIASFKAAFVGMLLGGGLFVAVSLLAGNISQGAAEALLITSIVIFTAAYSICFKYFLRTAVARAQFREVADQKARFDRQRIWNDAYRR